MNHIITIANDIINEYKTRIPSVLATQMGINLWYKPLGGLKGFYVSEQNVRYIVINELLDEITAKIVIAHEIGHDVLHKELSKSGMREHTMFLENNKTEMQANLFAAEILIPDADILEICDYFNTADDIAHSLYFPVELVKFKFIALNIKGYHFTVEDVSAGFLA